MRKKIAIIGAGAVGAQVGYWIALKELGDVVFVDINAGIAKGKALDLQQAMPVAQKSVSISGSGSYSIIKNAHIIVITAGFPRTEGMSRDTLLEKNLSVMKQIVPHIKKYAPDALLIVVTNPLDARVRY